MVDLRVASPKFFTPAVLHQDELLENWALAEKNQEPFPIDLLRWRDNEQAISSHNPSRTGAETGLGGAAGRLAYRLPWAALAVNRLLE